MRLLKKPQAFKSFAGQTGTDLWFDRTAFATAAQMNDPNQFRGQFTPRGARNQVFGPGFQSYNMALNKTMHVIPGLENHVLVFRAEAFNLANHPTPDTPDTNFTSATFGRSTTKAGTYRADRHFQFSLRYAF